MSNLFDDIPADLPEELIQTILNRPNLRIERIVSHGHASPVRFWFDQPMVARKPLSEYLDGLLTGRYARFVNDADIVPRVPPSHAPCGSLVWFTASGIKRSNRKLFGAVPNDVPARDGAEPVPLTDEQFRQLQAKLKAESAKSNRLPDGSPVFMAGPPLIDDHSMHLYLEKVRELLHDSN